MYGCVFDRTDTFFFPLWCNSPTRARAASFFMFLDHTHWHTTVGRTLLDAWSTRRGGNTQHSQETDIHDSGGIRTRNPSKRALANPRPRPLHHWDRYYMIQGNGLFCYCFFCCVLCRSVVRILLVTNCCVRLLFSWFGWHRTTCDGRGGCFNCMFCSCWVFCCGKSFIRSFETSKRWYLPRGSELCKVPGLLACKACFFVSRYVKCMLYVFPSCSKSTVCGILPVFGTFMYIYVIKPCARRIGMHLDYYQLCNDVRDLPDYWKQRRGRFEIGNLTGNVILLHASRWDGIRSELYENSINSPAMLQ